MVTIEDISLLRCNRGLSNIEKDSLLLYVKKRKIHLRYLRKKLKFQAKHMHRSMGNFIGINPRTTIKTAETDSIQTRQLEDYDFIGGLW